MFIHKYYIAEFFVLVSLFVNIYTTENIKIIESNRYNIHTLFLTFELLRITTSKHLNTIDCLKLINSITMYHTYIFIYCIMKHRHMHIF